MAEPALQTKNKASLIKTIMLCGFVAGSLDMLAAFFVYSFIMKVVVPAQILRGIAAGIFGKSVIGNNAIMAFIGLLFHFIIAYCFTIAYFLVYPHLKLLRYNAIISGLLYGIFVWLVMNFMVLPLSNAYHASFSWVPAIRGMIILMLCIGLPISLFTSKYYTSKKNNYN